MEYAVHIKNYKYKENISLYILVIIWTNPVFQKDSLREKRNLKRKIV